MNDDLVLHVAAVNAALVKLVAELAQALSVQGLLPDPAATDAAESLKKIAALIDQNGQEAYGDDALPNTVAVQLQTIAHLLQGRGKA